MADKDIVAELQEWASLKVGDMPNQWGPPLTEVLNGAIAEITRLRSLAGAVSAGNGDFRTVKALLPHAGTTGYPSAYGSLEAIPIGYSDDKPNTGC